jgi:transposase
MDIKTLGIDLAKNLFRVHGVDALGRTKLQRSLRRGQLLVFMAMDAGESITSPALRRNPE